MFHGGVTVGAKQHHKKPFKQASQIKLSDSKKKEREAEPSSPLMLYIKKSDSTKRLNCSSSLTGQELKASDQTLIELATETANKHVTESKSKE